MKKWIVLRRSRRAFTMVELVMAIAIIGVLAAVAVPKLFLTRNDAKIAICFNETKRLMTDITNSYAYYGFSRFTNTDIKDLVAGFEYNVTMGNGIREPADTLMSQGITYICQGEAVATFQGYQSPHDYNLTLRDMNPQTEPVAIGTAEKFRTIHMISKPGGSHTYVLFSDELL